MRHFPVGVVLGLALLPAGCAGRWIYNREGSPGRATTEVTVHTEPPGADVSVNGEYIGRSPLIVPVRYSHDVRLYERRRYLPWPHVESREVPSYSREFRFSANAAGYREGTGIICPCGEEKLTIRIVLKPR